MIFPTLVIGENWREQMAPFQGNNLTKIPKEQLAFFDEEPEIARIYQEGSVERIELKGGKLVNPLDPMFFPPGYSGNKPKISKKLRRVMVPLHEIYPTFEEYIEKFHKGKQRDPETGKYGYWWNTKSKWDWVSTEEPTFKDFLILGDRTTDYEARNGDINWSYMKQLWLEDANERWDKYERELAKREGDQKLLRNIFGIRPDDDKTSFLERRSHISVWAVVYNGEWYQKGTNGWWGNVALAKDWERNLEALIQSLPEDELITIVGTQSSEENKQ